MSRNNLRGNKAYDLQIVHGLKFRPEVLTLVGALVLDRNSNTLLLLDPGGAGRNVTMPTAEAGLWFVIYNTADAAEDLTIKNPAAVTIGTISQAELGFVFSDGTSWFVAGVGTST